LIVDDHEVVRHGVQDILTSRLGIQVVLDQARNAAEAINYLMETEYDLLLLDINMPGRNGLEVLEETRRLRLKTRVLILTSYSEEDFAVRAFKLGASGYLTKQSLADELVTAVQRILAGGKYVSASLAEKLAVRLGAVGDSEPHEALSHRELQILRLVAVGKNTREIAEELALSEKTVATYRTRIAEKTGLKSSVEIARYALKQHLVD
jgi:DNA-binding NarL/FixJ family response regulator